MSERAFFTAVAFFFTIIAVVVAFLLWDSHKRDLEFDKTAPVVQTCVSHNVRQKVLMHPN